MWISLALVSAVLLWGSGSSSPDPSSTSLCPSNIPRGAYLKRFGPKCYYFYALSRQDFSNAERICKDKGGILASVKSKEVQDFLYDTTKNYKDKMSRDLWIGLSDVDKEGEYVWRDGSKMGYNNFLKQAGSNTGPLDQSKKYQDCVVMDLGNGGKWKDIRCKSLILNERGQHFVCEFDVDEP